MSSRQHKVILEIGIAVAWQRPIKGCHSGRGIGHNENCYQSCFDSWRSIVGDVGIAIHNLYPDFNYGAWTRAIREGKTASQSIIVATS